MIPTEAISLLRTETGLEALALAEPGVEGLGAGLHQREEGGLASCLTLYTTSLAPGRRVARALISSTSLPVEVRPIGDLREGRGGGGKKEAEMDYGKIRTPLQVEGVSGTSVYRVEMGEERGSERSFARSAKAPAAGSTGSLRSSAGSFRTPTFDELRPTTPPSSSPPLT